MQISIFKKNAFTVVIHYLLMKMELLIYFLKLKIKESKEFKDSQSNSRFLDNVSGAGNMLLEQEMFPACAGSRTGLINCDYDTELPCPLLEQVRKTEDLAA